MEIRGHHRFAAGREAVWETLLDPEALRRAIPGCERFAVVGPGSYDVVLRVGIGAAKGRYRGVARVDDAREPEFYRVIMDGTGTMGSAGGEATLQLTEDGQQTVVRYEGDLRAKGGLARLGGHALTGTATLMLRQFFKSMESEVARRVP